MQWGEDVCFKVAGKIFAVLSLDSVPPSLCFKCTAETFVELCEREGIGPAPYVGRYKWVLLEKLDILSDAELEDLIRQSYEMVVSKSKGRAGVRVRKVKVKVKGGNHPSASLRAGSGHKGHKGEARSRRRS